MQTLNPFDKLKMKSRYKRGAFMNDELQGDSREYKEAARMYNHDLKEYYRQHNYQVMPEEEEENEEIKVIPLREGRNGNPSGYLSALGLKGNEAATVAAQPLRLQKGVDTLSDNKVLSRINLSGNKASSSSYPSVRLAQGYGRNTMSDTPIRLAQNDPNKKDPFLYENLITKELKGSLPKTSICHDLIKLSEVYNPDEYKGVLFEGNEISNANNDDEEIGELVQKSLDRCVQNKRDKEYCKRQAKSIVQCLLDARGEAAEKGEDYYDIIEYYKPSGTGEFLGNFFRLKR